MDCGLRGRGSLVDQTASCRQPRWAGCDLGGHLISVVGPTRYGPGENRIGTIVPGWFHEAVPSTGLPSIARLPGGCGTARILSASPADFQHVIRDHSLRAVLGIIAGRLTMWPFDCPFLGVGSIISRCVDGNSLGHWRSFQAPCDFECTGRFAGGSFRDVPQKGEILKANKVRSHCHRKYVSARPNV